MQELEAEILKHQKWCIKKEAGRYGGTFVCKQLVYAYAMWISPAFHLSVINYFDKHNLVESKLDALVNNVHTLGNNLIGQLDSVSLSIDDMNSHGSNWGSYGVAIRMAKKECRESLENLRDQIQLKLDLDN